MIEPDRARLDDLARRIAESPHNLVSAGERAVVRQQHVEEGLHVARAAAELIAAGGRWIDLGTGGGLPGLILAMSFPGNDWRLIDTVEKKAAAVRGFADALDIASATVHVGRAEDLAWSPEHRGHAQGVVARAVAPLRTLVELARGFVADGGWLVAVKGPQVRAELEAAERAMTRCRWRDVEVRDVASAPRPTRLVTMRAEGPPPEGIPRRSGVPQRRPL